MLHIDKLYWTNLLYIIEGKLIVQLFSFKLDTIRAVLKKELEIPLIEISDKNARLDGGDVLFTGKHDYIKYVIIDDFASIKVSSLLSKWMFCHR